MREIKKGTLKLSIIAATLFILQSMTVLAQPHVNLKAYKPGSGIALLHIDDLTEEAPALITVRDEKGIVLFKDKSKTAGYDKLIDFGKIGNGMFYVDVTYPGALVRKVVIVDNNKLKVEENSFYIHNRINKLQGNDKKMLVRLNKNLNEAVTVRIFDSEGNILHEKAGITDNHYTALFNMSKLSSGVYKLQMISDNFSSSRSFQVE